MDVRMYDPAIARFNGIDPVTHHSQGTSVAFDNNPIVIADPSGADGHQVNGAGNAYGMRREFGAGGGIGGYGETQYTIEERDESGNVTGRHDALTDEDGNFRNARGGYIADSDGIALNIDHSAEFRSLLQAFKTKTHTVDQYIKIWEKAHGVTMSSAQKKTLGRGCIGITCLELGNNLDYPGAVPPLDRSFSSFSQALSEAKALEDDIKANPSNYPLNARVIVFSVRFWSTDPNKFLPNSSGHVDMSTYDYEPRASSTGIYTNFDYGLYNSTTSRWWHANHMQPGMEIYESSLSHYSQPLGDFNRQVFSVAITTLKIK